MEFPRQRDVLAREGRQHADAVSRARWHQPPAARQPQAGLDNVLMSAMPDPSAAFFTHVEREFDRVDELAPGGGGPPVQAQKRGWQAWQGSRCIVMLGEPTLGKTCEFTHQHEALRAQNVASYLTLWRDWHAGDDLLRSVDDPHAFLQDLASGGPVHWFVDSLDEGRLQNDAAIGQLLKAVEALSARGLLDNLHLRLSCRSMEWRLGEQDTLTRRLTKAGLPAQDMVVLRLLPFSVQTMQIAARQKLASNHQVTSFITALQVRNLMPIAGHPLLLALMLAQWRDNGQVKDNRTDIYASAVEHLLRETNRAHLDRPARPTSMADRQAAAAELATRAVLGGFTNLNLPTSPVSSTFLNLDEVSTPQSHVLAALATPLFTQAGNAACSFVHRSFADYLAARRLAAGLASGWPLRRLLPLFPVKHGIPSPVREMAAWLAGLSLEFQQWLIANDPATACMGDTLRYTTHNRHALVTELARRFRGRSWQTDFDRYGDLGATLSEQDYRSLLDASNGAAVRTMALEMISASGRADLHDAVIEIAMDAGNQASLRTRAILVISKAPEVEQRHAVALTRLLDLAPEQDNDDEIAGAVLFALYPRGLGTEQAMRVLRMPRRDNLHGLFRLFWSRLFLERLPRNPSDRTTALNGLTHFFVAQIVPPSQNAQRDSLNAQYSAISCAPVAEVAGTLIGEALDSSGGWTDAVAEGVAALGTWSRQFGHIERLQSLRQRLATATARRGLLSWWLASTEAGRDVRLWELPLSSPAGHDEDFDVFAQACESAIADDERAAQLFRQAARLCGDFASTARVDRLVALAGRSAALQRAWERERENSLENEIAKSRREPVPDFELERALADKKRLEFWRAHLQQIRTGDTNLLSQILGHIDSDSGTDYLAPCLEDFGDQLGPDLREAFEAGVAVAWRDFVDLDGLWPAVASGQGGVALPNHAIVAVQGYALQEANGGVDLSTLSSAQVEVLFWAARHRDDGWRPMFDRLWQVRQDVVWPRVQALLESEAAGTCPMVNRLWPELCAADELPADFIRQLTTYALQTPLPSAADTRRRQFAFLRMHEDGTPVVCAVTAVAR
jgi:hypothetical protein